MTDQGWVKAGELHEGSKVLNSRKEYEVVESIEYKGYNEIEVYNLIVENYHTFFITELGLKVHNIDCKNATLGQIFKQVGDNISDTKIKGDFEDVIKKLDDIAERNNIEEYIKNFDSRFRGLDPNNLDEIKKIISDASKDIDNHSSSLFKGTEGVSKASDVSKYSNLDKGVNFSNKALEHMGESGRQVPIQTLQDAIKYGEALPDPRGSSATMYYITMAKNGKTYNLEVLYDKASNTVYHFEYARKAMGNLPQIKK